MRLFQAPLDTCLDSPLLAGLSVHGLHFTVYEPSMIIRLVDFVQDMSGAPRHKTFSKPDFLKDASFLLTVEVFFTVCLQFVFFTCGGRAVRKKDQTQFPDGMNRKQKRPKLVSGWGGTVSKKDQTDFPP